MNLTLFLVIPAGLFFISACNDGTKTSTTNSDTVVIQTLNMKDTMKVENGMMESMKKMMATMDVMQMTGDFDTDFSSMMIQHHQGAIDMAKIEVSKGTDEKVKRMAQNIIAKQTEEQGKLTEIVDSYKSKQSKPDSTHAEHRLHDVMINMMDKMKGMEMANNTDKDFLMMMIPHHESAIEMSKSELSFGKNSQLKQLAQKGITDQTKEIYEFKNWLSLNK